ncbi:MAG: VWA domain-containing protein [Planctomycetota bacterium]
MTLLAPNLLALAAVAVPLVLLYFLKLRRRKVAVSSTLLWQKTLEDLRVNAPFQRMKSSILLWLQLLILLLIVFAVARLVFKGEASPSQYRVLMIDTSASMGTVEHADGRTRLQLAVEAVRNVITEAPGDEFFCLMVFDKYAHNPLVNFTNERAVLLRALNDITLAETGTDPQESLVLAESLAELRRASIMVFTDGHFPEPPRVRLMPTFVPIGKTAQNVGIVNFSARRRVTDPTRFDLAVRIANFGDLPARWELQITRDGTVIDVLGSETKGLLAAPGPDPENPDVGSMRTFLIDDERLTTGLVQASLTVNDALECDNSAWLVLPALTRRNVLLLTDPADGHFYLERILGTQGGTEIAPEVSAVKRPRSDAMAVLVPDHGYDVIVLDSVPPEQLPAELPPGHYVFVNCAPRDEGWGLGDPIQEFPTPRMPPDTHPIMTFVKDDLGSIQLLKAPTLTVPDWCEPVLLAKGDVPLIAIGERNDRTTLVIGFDIFMSNWALQLSFPVFWANVLRYMFRGTVENEVFAQPTDRALAFPRQPTSDAQHASLRGTGRAASYRLDNVALGGDQRFNFGWPAICGVYTLRTDGEHPTEQLVALNLVNPDESDIRPRDSIAVQDTSTGAQKLVETDDSVIHQNIELWPWLLGLAMAVLLVEWWIFHRRPFG